MSTKGAQFLYLACQEGDSPPWTPVSYATARGDSVGLAPKLKHETLKISEVFVTF